MTVDEYNKSVDLYADGIFRFIVKNIKDEEKAKDVVQDTYEKLWMKIKDVSGEKVKSYLFTSAYHGMIDMIRRDKKQTRFEDINFNQHYTTETYSDAKEIVDRAAEKLPEIQRSVLMLRDYEGYSYKEIADITGLNESQVKVYIYRARVYLKEQLKSVDLLI